MSAKKYKVYLEVMRIIAIALVVFNHTIGYGLYAVSDGTAHYFYSAITMITRVNVPLFLMITGAVLLNRQEEYVDVFKKRIVRFVAVILIFDVVTYFINYYLLISEGKSAQFVVKDMVKGILSGCYGNKELYWYLYAYLGFLCLLPFIQRVVKGMKKSDFVALLVLHFIFSSLIPMVNVFFVNTEFGTIRLSQYIEVPLANIKVFFYPILGYYIEHCIDVKKLKVKHIVSLICISFFAIFIAVACTEIEANRTGQYSQGYVQLFDYVITIVAFIVIKYLFILVEGRINERVKRIICIMGSVSFGIYLLDPFIKAFIYEKYYATIFAHVPGLVFALGWVMISMIIGGIITYCLKKVPILRKLL